MLLFASVTDVVVCGAAIPPFLVFGVEWPCPNGFLTYRYAPACAARESRKVGHVSHVWGRRMGRYGSHRLFMLRNSAWVGAYRLGCDKS